MTYYSESGMEDILIVKSMRYNDEVVLKKTLLVGAFGIVTNKGERLEYGWVVNRQHDRRHGVTAPPCQMDPYWKQTYEEMFKSW